MGARSSSAPTAPRCATCTPAPACGGWLRTAARPTRPAPRRSPHWPASSRPSACRPTAAGWPLSAAMSRAPPTGIRRRSSLPRPGRRSRGSGRSPWAPASIGPSATGRIPTFTAGRSSAQTGPCWSTQPPAVVAVVTEGGRSHPFAFPYDAGSGQPAGRPMRLTTGDRTTRGLAVAGGRTAILGTRDEWAMELLEVARGRTRRLTREGSAWQRRLRQPVMTDRWIPGPGGPIETRLASPPGTDGATLPLVVDIHGGPLGGWAAAPSLEVQILCSAGYRVALPNIRGSAGYGAAWVAAPHGPLGRPRRGGRPGGRGRAGRGRFGRRPAGRAAGPVVRRLPGQLAGRRPSRPMGGRGERERRHRTR